MKRWEREGVIELEELDIPGEEHLKKGVAIIECVQEIPCNPCVDACPVKAISMEHINAVPRVDYGACTGCGTCVEVCPGLAIFLVKIEGEHAQVTVPYEFVPLPEKGDRVTALNREGEHVCDGVVKRVRKMKTPVVTIEVPREYAMEVRNIRVMS